MAAATFCKRIHQIGGTNSILNSTRFRDLCALNAAVYANGDNRSYSSLSLHHRYGARYTDTKSISQLVSSNGRRLFLVDTLALVSYLSLYDNHFNHFVELVFNLLNGCLIC